QSACIFEHVYFSRPDSVVFGRSVQASREAMGRQLAKESPVEADLVVPVPDSGVAAALGYSSESLLPFRFGLIRNHYIGRTLIESKKSVEESRDYIGADSLAYLSLEGLREACAEGEKTTYCSSCYTGIYPTEFIPLDQIQPMTVEKKR